MIIVLYFWTYFSGNKGPGLLIGEISIILAAVAFLFGTISYLWMPKKFITSTAIGVFLLLGAAAGSLVATSGSLQSPFIALWILISIFAAVFGVWGLAPLFIASSTYLFLAFLSSSVTQDAIIVTVAAGWLPLIASFIIWHGRASRDDTAEKAYRSLTSELNEVASKAEVVINAIADGVIAIDNQGIVQLINPAAQQITGWGKQDATTLNYKSVMKLTDKKDQELTSASDPIQQVLSTNKEIRTEDLSLITNAGKKLFISAVISPVGQTGAGAIVVFRDITKEKAEEREQAEFISTASHEMRTPVASIEGYLSLALNPAVATVDDKARDFITKAHASTKHLGRLFQDLLDVSKTDDGRMSNNPGVVDVVQFVHDVVEGLRPSAEAKKLRILFKPMPDDEASGSDRQLTPVYYVLVDHDHLQEIVANLTENAIKYTLAGDIVVDVTGDSGKVTISVADSGIGIPLEDIPHLFQKFYRVDNSDTREIGGTGLGLYLCRRLTEVMEGRIWVESEYKKGSTFFLELPRISHEKATSMIELAAQQAEAIPETIVETILPPEPMPLPEAPPTVAPTPVLPTQSPPQGQPVPQPAPAPQASYTEQFSTTPPANAVASQLRAASQQPPPYSATAILTSPHLNTPLSAIEQNPGQYTQPVGRPITIPVRDEAQQHQP